MEKLKVFKNGGTYQFLCGKALIGEIRSIEEASEIARRFNSFDDLFAAADLSLKVCHFAVGSMKAQVALQTAVNKALTS